MSVLKSHLLDLAIAFALVIFLQILPAFACDLEVADSPQRFTYERTFARSLAALIVDPVPDATAMAFQIEDGKDATDVYKDAMLYILDSDGCVLASDHVRAAVWDLALALIATPPAGRFNLPWVQEPGSNQLSGG